MSQGKITFSGGQSSSLDDLAGGVPAQVNVLTDAAGSLRVRPGISVWEDFPTTIPDASEIVQIGLFGQYLCWVTADRKIWALTASGTATALSDATAATQLDGALRPVITSTRTRLIVAGGGKPQKWEGAGLSARLGGNPPNFSHVATISQRLVGNDSGASGIMYWSGIGDTGHESWTTGLDFEEAETKPDPLIGLYESSNELAALGTKTLQMFSPDPSVTFSPARTMQIGVGSAYSFVGLDEQFMFLDTKRRAMLSNGRSFSSVSSPPISSDIDNLGTISDCWGFRCNFQNWDLAGLRFPTDGKTFMYDVPSKAWSEWRGYSTTTGTWSDFRARSHYYWEERKLHLVGLSDGSIAKLDPTVATDLGDPISVEITSPFVDHGVLEPKHCQRIVFKLRRGPAYAGAKILISYRDDNGPFCAPFERDLDGDSDVAIEINSLGVYRVRQWRIQATGVSIAVAGAQETFTLARGA
jgi:hypothetical protein